MIYAQWSDAKTILDLCARSKVVLKVCDQKKKGSSIVENEEISVHTENS